MQNCRGLSGIRVAWSCLKSPAALMAASWARVAWSSHCAVTSDSRQQRRQAAYCRLTLVNTLSARWQAGPVAPNGEECEVERIFELENIIMYHLSPRQLCFINYMHYAICHSYNDSQPAPSRYDLIMIKHEITILLSYYMICMLNARPDLWIGLGEDCGQRHVIPGSDGEAVNRFRSCLANRQRTESREQTSPRTTST